jgi:hypothetical protein
MECRKRALRCRELAERATNFQVKGVLTYLAEHWRKWQSIWSARKPGLKDSNRSQRIRPPMVVGFVFIDKVEASFEQLKSVRCCVGRTHSLGLAKNFAHL